MRNDAYGLMNVKTQAGYKYSITFIGIYFGFVKFVYLICHKSETLDKFRVELENQLGRYL